MMTKLNCNRPFIKIFLIALFLIPIKTFPQRAQPAEVSKEITEAILNDVWQPFMKSYRSLNVEKLKSIHAKDLTRVSISMNKIEDQSSYFKSLDGIFQSVKKMNRQMDIKFSIMSTAVNKDKAYQTGYYCFSSRASDSESFQPRGYGFFNVILIKENGAWKISMDADKQIKIDDDEFRNSGIVYELN